MKELNTIVNARINIKHLLIVGLLAGVLTYLIMNYIIIFLIWGLVGDGSYPSKWDAYINIIYVLSAIIFLFPVIYFRIRINYKKGNLSKVKDYLIICFLIILISALISYNQLR